MKLSTKLTLLILAAVLLPLLGLGSVLYVAQKQAIEARLHQQLLQHGASAIHHVSDNLLENLNNLKLVAGSSTLRGDVAQAQAGLDRYLSTFSHFDALVFTNNKGKPLARAGTPLLTRGETTLEQAAASWLQEAASGAVVIDRVTPAAGEMQRYLVLARRVSHAGVNHGWIFGQFNSEKMVAILNSVKIGETGRITLFNGNGILIGHPLKSRYGYDMSAYPIMRKPVVERVGDPGGFFLSGDGREKWGITLMLSNRPELARLHWGIIVDQTVEELHQPVTDLRKTILLGGLICGIISTLFGIGFARRLTAPLASLQLNLKGFFSYLNRESGAPPRRKIHGNDEFAQMAVAIDESISIAEANVARERELEAVRDEALNRLNKIAGRLPGMVFQFRLRPDGSSCMPYASSAIRGMYRVHPEDVRDDASAVFAAVHPDDLAQYLASMQASAHGLLPWYSEYRIRYDDASERWLRGNAQPEREADGSTLWYGFVTDVSEQKRAELERREVEERYRTIIKTSPDGFWTMRRDGKLVDANDAFCRMHGYSRDEVPQLRITDLTENLNAEQIEGHIRKLVAAGGGHFEARHRHKNGESLDVDISTTFQPAMDGGLFFSFARDITGRKLIERQMRQAMAVFSSTDQGIFATDAQGTITAVNPAFCRIMGYPREKVIGNKPSMFKSGRHDASYYQAMWTAIQTSGSWEGEIWDRRANGEVFPLWQTISAVRDGSGRIVEYVSVFTDITERKRHETAIWHQANFDALTGLANRSLFQDRLERALAQARRSEKKIGLLFIDLDRFKLINDTLGHEVGDELLVEVAQRLKACVRDQDTVARLGGDEFTIVVHELSDTADLRAIGEKAVNVLREPFTLAGTAQHISGSVGITIFPDDGTDVQTLLKNADIAMYQSKISGKNRFQFFASHMQADAQARVELEADLRIAIEDRSFELHYQPIVEAVSNVLIGVEALVRWRHPQRGTLLPDQFIAVAEDSGLINPIGEWVLREASAQWKRWQGAGPAPLCMSVNVSGVQLTNTDWPALIGRLFDEHCIERGCLMLEIKEALLMSNSEAAGKHLHEAAAAGVIYSLDNFGTGLSPLSCLKRFPIRVIKIDQSYIGACIENPDTAILIKAIINMAHSIGLHVTAEGVETRAQQDFLRMAGCDYLQGFLIGRPQPAAEFTRQFICA